MGERFEAPGLTPEGRADDVVRRFAVLEGLTDTAELRWFIARAITAASAAAEFERDTLRMMLEGEQASHREETARRAAAEARALKAMEGIVSAEMARQEAEARAERAEERFGLLEAAHDDPLPTDPDFDARHTRRLAAIERLAALADAPAAV